MWYRCSRRYGLGGPRHVPWRRRRDGGAGGQRHQKQDSDRCLGPGSARMRLVRRRCLLWAVKRTLMARLESTKTASPWIARVIQPATEGTGGRNLGASLLDPIHERSIRRHDGDGLRSLGFGDELRDVVIGRVSSRP